MKQKLFLIPVMLLLVLLIPDTPKLRKMRITDLMFLFKLIRHNKIKNYSRNRDLNQLIEDMKSSKKIILYKNRRVGCVREYEKEISIAILPDYWNKGIGTKVIKMISKHKHNLKAKINPHNFPSINVFKRNSFKFVNHTKDKLDLYVKI